MKIWVFKKYSVTMKEKEYNQSSLRTQKADGQMTDLHSNINKCIKCNWIKKLQLKDIAT